MSDVEREIEELEIDVLAAVIVARMHEGDAWRELEFASQEQAKVCCLLAESGCSIEEVLAYMQADKRAN